MVHRTDTNDGQIIESVRRILPDRGEQYYREWYMALEGQSKGIERIVTGKNGEVFYSPNHYKGFIRIDDGSLDSFGDILAK